MSTIWMQAIRNALADHAGNRTAAARRLGIDPSTLHRKMHRYQIDPKPRQTATRSIGDAGGFFRNVFDI